MDNAARSRIEPHSSFHKLASLIELYAELDRQSCTGNEIPRRRLAANEFYDAYFYPNRPVIVEGLMTEWPAMTKWTFSWLQAEFGDIDAEVHANRNRDPLYERHLRENCLTMKFGDFIRAVDEGGATNDIYLVGRNELLAKSRFRPMLEDVPNPDTFLDPQLFDHRYVKLWIGPAGTITPLHHDRGSVFLAQVMGRKHVKLISPFHLPYLRNDPMNCYSDIDLNDPVDLERYPEMREVPVMEGVIHPGDFLFLPVAWWHWLRALDKSISLTFKNFRFKRERVTWKYR